MSGYRIPPEVHEDFALFRQQHADFLAGRLDDLTFKTLRVPFGIYEQRTAGTYMVRIKLAGGVLTPAQLAALADLAETRANGQLHVTTRGGVQLHYVRPQDFPEVVERLHAIGLTGRGGGGNTVRNITADPLAGIAPDEVFDVTPHAIALTEKMLAQKDSYALPRKFKLSFSGSAADRGGATFIDVGFIAKLQDGERGFRVFVGGGMGAHARLGQPFLDFLPETEVFLLAQAIKEVFDARGNRRNKHAARLRFLIDALGLEPFRALVEEKIAALRQRGDWRLELPPAFRAESPPEMPSARTLAPEEALWRQRFVTAQKQAGLYAVKIPLSQGDLPVAAARQLAALLERLPHAEHTLRCTTDQNLWLRNLAESDLAALYPLAGELSPLARRPALLGNVVVCTGAATCQLGITVPRGAQIALEKHLAKSTAALDLDAIQGLTLHLSGCPNSCGKHEVADLGFFGKAARQNGVPYPAYNVFAGARIGEDQTRFAGKIGEVAAIHLPRFIEAALIRWQAALAATPGLAFADWIDGEGKAILAELTRHHRAVPDFEDDKNPYFDWQGKEVFSLKGRGVGECSAGMYDLIEADKKALLAALKQPAPDPAAIRLLAARMLLVTRGEDAREEAAVLAAFQKQFIDSGLIDARFSPFLQGPATPEVQTLAHAVLALYERMDNTLQFSGAADGGAAHGNRPASGGAAHGGTADSDNAGESEAASFPADQPRYFKDYRGVACPMNFVKTKMDLARMQSGEILEIVLDDGPPIDNVPQSVKGEGHAVLEQIRKGEVWHVKIRKK